MEKSSELSEGLEASEEVIGNGSWFKNTPHYWAEASLPLAYAVACVEVICKNSENVEILYNKPDVMENDSYVLTTGQTWA
jgi:hypothetical protein